MISEWKHITTRDGKAWDYCNSTEEFPLLSRDHFLAFLNNPVNAPGMQNRQTKMIAGIGSYNYLRDVYPTDDELLYTAKKHLLQLTMFGLTEFFTEGHLMLRSSFQLDIDDDSIRNFTSVEEPSHDTTFDWKIDEEITSNVLALNSLDYELYQFAAVVFERRWELWRTVYNFSLNNFLTYSDNNVH